jgi:hypothetical protein
MAVLVDTSVWVEYFRSGENLEQLDFLLSENLVATNELILAELIPFLRVRQQRKVIELLQEISRLPLKIEWEQLGEFQYQCLKAGHNGMGIPDLIIAQNALQNDCQIYTLDKHFTRLAEITPLKIIA